MLTLCTSLPVLTADQFFAGLRASRLLSLAKLALVEACRPVDDTDASAWAEDLVRRRLISAYQAQQLLIGKGDALVLGQYRILEHVGAGGMGQVFKAEHHIMKRVVAVKIIADQLLQDTSAVTRFHREVQVAAQLVHPNIVTAYDADEASGHHFLVMEYVEGTDLRRLVELQGPLPVPVACEYIRQAALGLQHAHERGLVHCDIKPANLIVRHEPEPVVKILDFGLARLAGVAVETSEGSRYQSASEVEGTPDYMAPEVARNMLAADIRSDLYSLGCTLYYLLTGQVPFPGGSWSEKLLGHQYDPVMPVTRLRTDVPAEVAAIVHRLLAKIPEDRYPTPQLVADALQAWLEGSESPVMTPALAPTTPLLHAITQESSVGHRPVKRALRPRPLVWLGAVALGLIAACMFRWSGDAENSGSISESASSKAQRTNRITLESAPGKSVTDLGPALAEAQDGDIVTIAGDGPYSVPPITLHGKSLLIRSEPGSRPRIQLNADIGGPQWQPMLRTDRPLVLDGLDLVCENAASRTSSTTIGHLVYADDAEVRLRNCRLIAPHCSALVVCRNASVLELTDCSLEGSASAVCLEVGARPSPKLQLTRSRLLVHDQHSAAMCVWQGAGAGSSSPNLIVEDCVVDAGRVFSLDGESPGTQVLAQRNHFTFHESLVSIVGLKAPEASRHCVRWHGQENICQGPQCWLTVNGISQGIATEQALNAYWGSVNDIPLTEAPFIPVKTALHAPPH